MFPAILIIFTITIILLLVGFITRDKAIGNIASIFIMVLGVYIMINGILIQNNLLTQGIGIILLCMGFYIIMKESWS